MGHNKCSIKGDINEFGIIKKNSINKLVHNVCNNLENQNMHLHDSEIYIYIFLYICR